MRELVGALWRADRRGVGVLLGVVAAVAAVSVGIDAWATAERDRTVERTLEAASPLQREVRLRTADVVTVDAVEPIGSVAAELDARAASLPDGVRAVLGPAETVIDSARFAAVAVRGVAPDSPTFLTFRTQTGYPERSTVVAGRRAEEGPAGSTDPGSRRLEVEVSTATAEVLGVDVGDELDVVAALDDTLGRRYRTLPDPFVVEVVGIVQLTDRTEPDWFDDDRLHEPVVVDTGIGADLLATVAVPAPALATAPYLDAGVGPLGAERRARVDVELATDVDAGALVDAVQRLDATSARTVAEGEVAVVTGLGALLDVADVQRVVLGDAATVATAGVVVVGVLLVAQLAELRTRRSRSTLELLTRRGAGRARTAGAASIVAGCAAVLGAVLGAGVALAWTSRIDAGRVSALLVVLAGVAVATAARSVARVEGGVERVEAGGVPIITWTGRPGGWPRWRQVFVPLLGLLVSATIVTVGARSGGALDGIVLVGLWAPVLGVGWAVSQRSPSAVVRSGALVVVAAITTSGALVALARAADAPVDGTVGELVMAVVGCCVVSAVAAAVMSRGEAGADRALAARTEAVDGADPAAERSSAAGPLATLVVAVALGVAWVAILHRVLPDRVDLFAEAGHLLLAEEGR